MKTTTTTVLMAGILMLLAIPTHQVKTNNPKKDSSYAVLLAHQFSSSDKVILSEYACISNLNVTLNEFCTASLLPIEVLTGDLSNAESFMIRIDNQPTDIISGCGWHTYDIDVIENGQIVYTCGGNLFAEDKTPPEITCPSDVDQLLIDNGIDPPVFYDLLCSDIDSLLIVGQETYVIDEAGMLVESSISSNLRRILNLTSFPEITENCGPVQVIVYDELINNGDCGGQQIVRHFEARDHFGGNCQEVSYTDNCRQMIRFRSTTLADVNLPDTVATLACNQLFSTDGIIGGVDDNPAAIEIGIPFVSTAFGDINLMDAFCNIGVSYSDEPRITTCDGAYEFRREWNLIDWCDLGNAFVFNQFIAIQDTLGPSILLDIPDYDNNGIADNHLEYATSPFNCEANFTIPLANIEDANSCSAIETRRVSIYDDEDHFIWLGHELEVVTLDTGSYAIEYCAKDYCANETCTSWDLIIADKIAPTAVCKETLNVLIGGGDIALGVEGNARIFADAINQGSSDNCSPVTLKVRRNHWFNGTCHHDENRWGYWDDFIDFSCCDIHRNITVELQATDQAGNSNICWLNIVPEDNLVPFCYAPEDITISCVDLPATFPGDIALAYSEDFVGTSIMMTALFGNAQGTDNCAVDTIVERNPQININSCGWGVIRRRFQVWQLKPAGDINNNALIEPSESWLSSNYCPQTIYITETHSYQIDFPQDATASCADPCIWDTAVEVSGCDILAVNRSEPERFDAEGEECYQLKIIHDVINWCLWDGEYEGYTVARVTEDDGEDLAIDKAVESTERPVIIGNDDGVTLDRNHLIRPICMDGSNGYLSDDDSFLEDSTDIQIPDLNRGRWNYTQFVKVFDTTFPEIHIGDFGGPTDLCPDLEYGQFGEPFGDCMLSVYIPFTVTDSCELFDSEGELVVSLASAEIDYFALDSNFDGQISGNELNLEADIFNNITQNGDGSYIIEGEYPVLNPIPSKKSYHAVQVEFEDGCGNRISQIIQFGIVDCKPTAPICINGLTVTLIPDATGGCSGVIWASDFEASPVYDCTGQGPERHPVTEQFRITKYAIFRATEVNNNPNFVPYASRTSLTFTEEDLEQENILVYVYTFDEVGNYDYCETYVNVEGHLSCRQETALLSGNIMTTSNTPIPNVEVSINGNETVLTDEAGNYQRHIVINNDYSVFPQFDDNYLDGVSTFDLVLISKHILGTQLLDSPYKLIAADANRSNTITTLDLIQIRKLILNIIPAFENNTSWRFIDANYIFPEQSNPWSQFFPEVLNLNDFDQDYLEGNFIGVKIGDVN